MSDSNSYMWVGDVGDVVHVGAVTACSLHQLAIDDLVLTGQGQYVSVANSKVYCRQPQQRVSLLIARGKAATATDQQVFYNDSQLLVRKRLRMEDIRPELRPTFRYCGFDDKCKWFSSPYWVKAKDVGTDHYLHVSYDSQRLMRTLGHLSFAELTKVKIEGSQRESVYDLAAKMADFANSSYNRLRFDPRHRPWAMLHKNLKVSYLGCRLGIWTPVIESKATTENDGAVSVSLCGYGSLVVSGFTVRALVHTDVSNAKR